MIGAVWTSTRRQAAIFAAILAVALNVLVPAGFMVGDPGSPGLVLCTGHGPVLIASDLGGSSDRGANGSHSKGEGPCAFVGHGAAPPLAAAPALIGTATTWAPIVEPPRETALLRPRLAAPPPPSQGPPAVSI